MPEPVTQPEVTPASAPVAAESVETLSASEAAVEKGFDAFQKARHAERFPDPSAKKPEPARVAIPAKPVEPVTDTDGDEDTSDAPVPAASVAAPQPARTLSKQQIAINESIRRAVEPLHAEIARLKAQTPAPVAKPEPQAPAADLEPDPSDATKYPDGQFDKSFIKDLSRWQTRQDLKEFQQGQVADRQRDEQIQSFQTRASQSREKLQTALKADPDALKDIDPALTALKPSIALGPGESSTFGNVVADWLIDTEYPVALLKHLSNREEVHRLATLAPATFLREQGRIEAGFAKTPPAPETPLKESAKPITQSPDPAQTLGTRPVDTPDALRTTVKDGDYLAYKAEKRARGLIHYAG